MIKSILLSIPVFFLFAFTCERIPTFTLDETFEMKIGDRRSSEELKVMLRLDEMTEDSRCPKNTNCVWEGQVKMKFTLMTEEAAEQSFELTLLGKDEPGKASKAINGYTYKMTAVAPYPEAGSKIDTADYVVMMKVVEGEVGDAGNTDEQ